MSQGSPRDLGLRGLVLAAGASTRLGYPKQLVPVNGVPLVRRTAQIVAEVCGCPATVVIGSDAERVARCLEGTGTVLVHHPGWARGLGSSLGKGLAALASECQAVLVAPCDLPCLSAADLGRLVEAWRRAPAIPAACGYDGVLGTPAILPAGLFPDLIDSEGDAGARLFLRRTGTPVTTVAMDTAAMDLDQWQDLDDLEAVALPDQGS